MEVAARLILESDPRAIPFDTPGTGLAITSFLFFFPYHFIHIFLTTAITIYSQHWWCRRWDWWWWAPGWWRPAGRARWSSTWWNWGGQNVLSWNMLKLFFIEVFWTSRWKWRDKDLRWKMPHGNQRQNKEIKLTVKCFFADFVYR